MKKFLAILFFSLVSILNSEAQILADFSLNKTVFCESDTLIFSNLSQNYTYTKWDFGDGTQSYTQNPKHIYKTAGDYSVTLSAFDSNGYISQKTESISISANPTLSLTPSGYIVINSGTPLNVEATGNFTEFSWSDGRIENPITVTVSGTYTVLVKNEIGCQSTDSLIVKTQEIPQAEVKIIVTNNILTPNGDGINDYLVISDFDKFTDKCSIEMYNRWGNLVFENQNYKNDWNGTDLNGNSLESGTYYYIIKTTGRTGGTGFIDVVK